MNENSVHVAYTARCSCPINHNLNKTVYTRFYTIPTMNSTHSQMMCGAVVRRLKDVFGANYGAFAESMRVTEAILTGSFILSCLYDDFVADDIDIVLNKSSDDTKFTALENFMYTAFGKPTIKEMGAGYIPFANDDPTVHTSIYDVREYNVKTAPQFVERAAFLNGKKVQLIRLAGKTKGVHAFRNYHIYSPAEHVEKCFDFDIVKNYLWYDGLGEARIYIHNLYDLITRSTLFTFPVGLQRRSVARCQKYTDRGIKFHLDKKRVGAHVHPAIDMIQRSRTIKSGANDDFVIVDSEIDNTRQREIKNAAHSTNRLAVFKIDNEEKKGLSAAADSNFLSVSSRSEMKYSNVAQPVAPVAATTTPVAATTTPAAATTTPAAASVAPAAATIAPAAASVAPAAATIAPAIVPGAKMIVPFPFGTNYCSSSSIVVVSDAPVAATVTPVAATVTPVAATVTPVAASAPVAKMDIPVAKMDIPDAKTSAIESIDKTKPHASELCVIATRVAARRCAENASLIYDYVIDSASKGAFQFRYTLGSTNEELVPLKYLCDVSHAHYADHMAPIIADLRGRGLIVKFDSVNCALDMFLPR